MASRDDASEVWKVARSPRDADFIYCLFPNKDDESACNQKLNVPNGSGHVKRHFDRAHKDTERYRKEPPSTIKYTCTATTESKYSSLSLREILLQWCINVGIPFTSIECPEALEIVRRCGEPSRGFSGRDLTVKTT